MPDKTPLATAVAVRELISVAFIDGGDTVAVRFAAANGQIVGVVIPRRVFAELQAAVPDGRIVSDNLVEAAANAVTGLDR